MLRRIQASFVLLCLASVPAVAQEPTDDGASSVPAAPPPTAEPPSAVPSPPPQEAKSSTPPSTDPGGWHMELSGYFRAPMAMGISSRPAPDSQDTDMNSPTFGKL